MMKARLLTIGTEITAGEVLNSNAAWISERLEDLGVRVFSHLTVRDQRDEVLAGLGSLAADILIVTGGLGPTSDDLTRGCVAEFAGVDLEFDESVWTELGAQHASRGLASRDSHRHQCWFPKGSERLPNPVGTALGFHLDIRGRAVFVLPGPPRELAAMWSAEVEPRLRPRVASTKRKWVRWTCLGAPESEVADRVEPVIAGRDVEVGYRAQVPYVKVKVFVDPEAEKAVIDGIERELAPWIVARGTVDLADELLDRWPGPELHVIDKVTRLELINRLITSERARLASGRAAPVVDFHSTHEPTRVPTGLVVHRLGEELLTELHLDGRVETDRRRLMFKLQLDSERGRRAAAEWAIWFAVKSLRSRTP